MQNDRGNVRERLDVVHDGRQAEQSRLRGKGRLVARLATKSFDGIEDCRFFAADIGARAAANFDVEANATTQNVVAEEVVSARGVDGVLDAGRAERIFAPNVEEAALTPRGKSGDRHRLDDGERIALEQHAILERAGFGFVRVADEVVRTGRLFGDGIPFTSGG